MSLRRAALQPRPPPPPLLFSLRASSSSRRRDRRGPSQPPRPVWGPAPPRVPGPPRPARSCPAPAPPLGGDARGSSPSRPVGGGDTDGRPGGEAGAPTANPGPSAPRRGPTPPPRAERSARGPHPSPRKKSNRPGPVLGGTQGPGDPQSRDADLSLPAEFTFREERASLCPWSCLQPRSPSPGGRGPPRSHLTPATALGDGALKTPQPVPSQPTTASGSGLRKALLLVPTASSLIL